MNDLAARPNTNLASQGLTGLISGEALETVMNIGRLLSASGFFADAKNEAEAGAKILAGLEYGFAPVTSMKSFHVITIKGVKSIEMTAAAKVGVIKRSGYYTTRIREHDENVCAIETYERDPVTGQYESLGIVRFTMEDAHRAKLTGRENDMYLKYPADMLYARVASRIAKRHTPELFTQDQLRTETDDAEIDAAVIKAATTAPTALPGRETASLSMGEEAAEAGRRQRRIHVLAKDLGWNDETRHRETAALFEGRMSLNDLDLDELGQLIENMATHLAFDAAQGKAPEFAEEFNPGDVTAYDLLAQQIARLETPATHRGDKVGITAAQTKRILELATAAGLNELEMKTLATAWSGGVALQDLTTDDVNRFGAAVKEAVGA